MDSEEEKELKDQEKVQEKPLVSLLNYECDEADDGTDWET